jgi:hypothetical protein
MKVVILAGLAPRPTVNRWDPFGKEAPLVCRCLAGYNFTK